MDGIPLLPLAKSPANGTNRDILFESPDIGTYGIRRGPWKYDAWNNGDEELYNLDSDPYELTNLLHGPGASSYTDIRDQLAARLAQLRVCNGPTCR